MKRSASDLQLRPPSYCMNCPASFRAKTHIDMHGKEFPGLIVLRREGEWRGIKTLWRCKCRACGKECVVAQRKLKSYKSCGCLSEKERKNGMDFNKTLYKNGTNYPSILPTRKKNKNNRSGVRGVCKGVCKKYRSYINFQGRQIRLGEYDDLEDAIRARKEAEEKYYKPAIDNFEESGIRVKGPYKKKGSNKND